MMTGNIVRNGKIRLHYVGNHVSGSSSDVRVVLIHGLDSSSHTWKRTMDSLEAAGVGAVAMDCRGCGRSDLGDPDNFSPSSLVDDLHHVIMTTTTSKQQKLVLVGHSMGGRIAMSYAAQHPDQLAALVIEDMDIDRRPNNPFPAPDGHSVLQFDRNLQSHDESTVLDTFQRLAGYPSTMVQRWIKEGRIYLQKSSDGSSDEESFWSDVNPAFRHLCYQHFCYTDQGENCWNQIATNSVAMPCHVMVASKDNTICRPESIKRMERILGHNSGRMTLYEYPSATHSIHNSVHTQFISNLLSIVQQQTK